MSNTLPRLSLALYQPDIPQNTGTMLRLGACLGISVHIIEPAGFILSDVGLKRAGMDYLEIASMTRHTSWTTFNTWRQENEKRLVLMTTKAATPYTDIAFQQDDIILMGRESSGVPQSVHNSAEERAIIPMQQGARSLNVACSAAMVLGEALRQVAS